jgi:hypothetical protein
MGFIEGQNIAIEDRWAENDTGNLPQLAAVLVHCRMNLKEVIKCPMTVPRHAAIINKLW